MFNAMRHGKAGRTAQDLPAGTAMRDLFRRTEDLLTGTVFERLGYLPGAEAWALLRGTFAGLPDRRMVEIIDIDFWPNWETSDEGRRFVEPDVVLTLDLGDPAQRTVLIVEAKTAGGQSASQWEDQLRAHQLQLDGEEETIDVIYAALGGLNGMTAEQDWNTVPEKLRTDVRFVHGDWNDLAQAIADHTPEAAEAGRVIEDISAALSLYGYVSKRLSEALFEIDRPVNTDQAMIKLLGEAA